jgi:hypothetical protein
MSALKTLLTGWATVVLLSGGALAQGIYTCTDAKGRKITSDRPIPECNDRTQNEITPSGTVRRVIGPSLTAQERAAAEEKEKAVAENKAQALEEKRRDQALLLRYPNRQAHDAERTLALTQVEESSKGANKKLLELAEQRKLINVDLEFYKKDASKTPPPLRRRVEENDSNVAVQKRFIADQDAERRRVNQRFDTELVKLKPLWTNRGASATTAGPDSKK